MTNQTVDILRRLQRRLVNIRKFASEQLTKAEIEDNQELAAYWRGMETGYNQAARHVEYEILDLRKSERICNVQECTKYSCINNDSGETCWHDLSPGGRKFGEDEGVEGSFPFWCPLELSEERE